jgi:hypothetical protein
MDEAASNTKGSCLCGNVNYKIRGPLRDVINCHCWKCRKHHGHISAHTSCLKEDLFISNEDKLTWYESVKDESKGVLRGFCSNCGSSLFWKPEESQFIYISAGTLDSPSGVVTGGHIWLSQKGDYYEINDGLPAYEHEDDGDISDF